MELNHVTVKKLILVKNIQISNYFAPPQKLMLGVRNDHFHTYTKFKISHMYQQIINSYYKIFYHNFFSLTNSCHKFLSQILVTKYFIITFFLSQILVINSCQKILSKNLVKKSCQKILSKNLVKKSCQKILSQILVKNILSLAKY